MGLKVQILLHPLEEDNVLPLTQSRQAGAWARALPGGLGLDAEGLEKREAASHLGPAAQGATGTAGVDSGAQSGCPASNHQAGQCLETPPFEGWLYRHHPQPKPRQTHLSLGGPCIYFKAT